MHNEASYFGPYTSRASEYFIAAKMYELMFTLSSVASEKVEFFLHLG
jgi:hypothetical protein